jgi:hypothetical protein
MVERFGETLPHRAPAVGARLDAPIGIKIRKKGDKGTHFVDADGVESSSIHEGASR